MAVVLIDKYDIEANTASSKSVGELEIGSATVTVYRLKEDVYIVDFGDLARLDDHFHGAFIANKGFNEELDALMDRSLKYRREIVRTELPDNEDNII